MAGFSAVIFVPDDTVKTGLPNPLMLSRIMGSPLLSWLVSALISRGAGRFFLVCNQRFHTDAVACFPKDIELTSSSNEDASDLLHVFLSTSDESEPKVAVITGPSVFLDPTMGPQGEIIPVPSCSFHIECETLMAAIDEQCNFLDFLHQRGKPYTDRDGVYSIRNATELASWQPILNRQHLHNLTNSGVEIWDYENCYVDPSVRMGSGSVILPGTILRGECIIGKNCTIGPHCLLENVSLGDGCHVNQSQMYDCSVGESTQIGPFAYVRPNCTIGNRVKVGDFVEVKNSVIGDGTKIAHLTYVGDADVGKNVNFGCGCVTVNYDRAKKHRTSIEDNAFIGCNTNLIAPIKIGQNAYTGAGSTITDDVPNNALAIGRARQNTKKEWSTKHKLK